MNTEEILNLITERRKYPVRDQEEELNYIADKLNDEETEIKLILPPKFFISSNKQFHDLKKLVFENWYVVGIFDIGPVYLPVLNVNFSMMVLRKSIPVDVFLGRYSGTDIFDRKMLRSIEQSIDSTIVTKMFSKYVGAIEETMHTSIIPKKQESFNIYKVLYIDFNYSELYTRYYDLDLVDNEKKLQQENIDLLKNLADVISPHKIIDQEQYVLRCSDFKYPINFKNVKKENGTNFHLKKGDILFPLFGDQQIYLLNVDPPFPITPSQHCLVIRIKDKRINPEYVFLFLMSDTAKKYMIRRDKGTLMNFNKLQLMEFPIILPNENTLKKSRSIFEKLFLSKDTNIIEQINKELFETDTLVSNTDIQTEFILEKLENLKTFKLDIIDKLLKPDFKELEKCFDGKIYKSCLILCGSIMEAILLDWISEIEKKDYYALNQDINLVTMINTLKSKKYINSKLSDKAHQIRMTRNIIHPKRYLQSREKISDEMCRKVIDGLKEILIARGIKVNKNVSRKI